MRPISKRAGEIELPRKLYMEIISWIKTVPKIHEREYVGDVLIPTYAEKFIFDISDSPIYNRLEKRNPSAVDDAISYIGKIAIVIEIDSSVNKFSATYEPGFRIVIVIPDIRLIEKRMDLFNKGIIHELVHAMQHFITIFNDANSGFKLDSGDGLLGIPNKYIDYRNRMYGDKDNKEKQKIIYDIYGDIDDDEKHTLSDAEFYPILAEEGYKMRALFVRGNVAPDMVNEWFGKFIKTNEIAQTFWDHDKNKHKKYVKLMHDYVMKVAAIIKNYNK